MIHMFVTKGDLVSIFWGVWVSQTPQMCSSSLNWPKNEKEKKWKKDRKQRERERETKFSGVRWLSSKAILSDSTVSSPTADIHHEMVES